MERSSITILSIKKYDLLTQFVIIIKLKLKLFVKNTYKTK